MAWGEDGESPLDIERAAHVETKRKLQEAYDTNAKLYRTITKLKLEQLAKD
ncbi:hypothetical protein LCGC14_2899600 [marine sediment metagenome]|uniref:Uncharacterized protein n=1 Tax=marine sediment metagenome TaxID=412755 RepID=A0A0F9A2Q0_9ZZZZ